MPLIALAASGRQLPSFPAYDYEATPGDGFAYYSAAREFIASWGRVGAGTALLLVIVLVVGAVGLIWAWRKTAFPRVWLALGSVFLVSLVFGAVVLEMATTGAGAVGWPLLWGIVMLPYRAVGGPLDPDVAFAFGLAISLVANVVTVVAVGLAGLYASGRRSVGLLAASLIAFWPLIARAISGTSSFENGSWNVDVGLHMYTEPVSTALIAVSLALLLRRQTSEWLYAGAGVAAGLAIAVRPTNALLALAAFFVLVIVRGVRPTLPYAGGVLSVIVIPAAFWPRRFGYSVSVSGDPEGAGPTEQFALSYFGESWLDSLVFSPVMLLVLLPIALVGMVTLRYRYAAALLAVFVLANPVIYSFFWATWQHPRYIYGSLPATVVLWAAGLSFLVLAIAKLGEGRLWAASRDPAKLS